MLAKPQWFQKRKYGGWGINPRTWQGWAYLGIYMAVLIIFQSLPFWNNATRVVVTAIWAIILLMDTTRIMMALKKDEMEQQIEAMAERNASWMMVTILVIGILFQVISSGLQQRLAFDPFLGIALVAGMLVKGLSYLWIEKRGVK